MNKNAVVCLTRGHNNNSDYSILIDRNKYIEKYISDNIDYIIFHEGNINFEQQNYISSYTPKLNLKFINVGNEFINYDYNKFNEKTKGFRIGYRNMCSFWFIGFYKYVTNYDNILRIDSDCNCYFDYKIIFNYLKNKVSVYGRYTEEESKDMCIGLNEFTINFYKEHYNKNVKSKKTNGPYTNLIGLNLKLLQKNIILNKYIEDIKKSENIYIYRWGDLPLWGEVFYYMYNDDDHVLLKDIKYLHKSHNMAVNYNYNNIDIFTNTYEKEMWGHSSTDGSYNGSSGSGSKIQYNIDQYIPFMHNFIKNNKVNTVIDLGCGDWQCSNLLYKDFNIKYYGYDAYNKIIVNNKNKYPKYNFIHLDFINNKRLLEKGDMCIIKDVLQHLCNKDINDLIEYLINNKLYKYIIICNCWHQKNDNDDIENGQFRPLTINKLPLKKFKPKILLNYISKDNIINKELSLIEI